MNLDTILCEGVFVTSSGTTGVAKNIYRTPKNLAACIEVATQAQDITQSSKSTYCNKNDPCWRAPPANSSCTLRKS